MNKALLFFLSLAAAVSAPAAQAAKTDLWVYGSIYKEYFVLLESAFEAKHPDIDLKVFQAGSEKIQAKVEAELTSGQPQADVILSSDPFWPRSLQSRGLLLDKIDTNYFGALVLIVHPSLPPAERPKSFLDLKDPKFKGKIQMGSPLESGTHFTAVAALVKRYGWDYFAALAKNGLASNGGNSTVLQKVESGEKKIGIILVENVLAAKKRGSPIEWIQPSDGAIGAPSVQFTLKATPHADAARAFRAFILSEEGQKILRTGYMYPAHKKVPAPDGVPAFDKITAPEKPWVDADFERIAKDSKNIKKRFSELVLE